MPLTSQRLVEGGVTRVEDQTIVPGPCQGPCPSPTEIDCIQVNKVYDFCFEAETNSPISIPIPASCGTLPAGTTAQGAVTGSSCTVIGSTPILNPAGQPTGFADVTLLISVSMEFTLTGPTGTVICTFPATPAFSFMKTIVLCAPAGTTITCTIPSSAVSPAAIVDGSVVSAVTICILVSSIALVNLLVPSYGFCTPAPCVVAPSPPFACPPSPLFPPQCTTPQTVMPAG
jgi:hypothetical protein